MTRQLHRAPREGDGATRAVSGMGGSRASVPEPRAQVGRGAAVFPAAGGWGGDGVVWRKMAPRAVASAQRVASDQGGMARGRLLSADCWTRWEVERPGAYVSDASSDERSDRTTAAVRWGGSLARPDTSGAGTARDRECGEAVRVAREWRAKVSGSWISCDERRCIRCAGMSYSKALAPEVGTSWIRRGADHGGRVGYSSLGRLRLVSRLACVTGW